MVAFGEGSARRGVVRAGRVGLGGDAVGWIHVSQLFRWRKQLCEAVVSSGPALIPVAIVPDVPAPGKTVPLASGHLFCIHGRRGDLLKVIWHDAREPAWFTKRLERAPQVVAGRMITGENCEAQSARERAGRRSRQPTDA